MEEVFVDTDREILIHEGNLPPLCSYNKQASPGSRRPPPPSREITIKGWTRCVRGLSRRHRLAAFVLVSLGFLLAALFRRARGRRVCAGLSPGARDLPGRGPIKIDGDLGDAGWRGAAQAANFAEHNPGNQTKPAVDTEAFITYDDNYLYVGFLCHDKPEEVRASFCERDKVFSDDLVFLCLDTYGEATHAYEIAVNPYGIPGGSPLLAGRTART